MKNLTLIVGNNNVSDLQWCVFGRQVRNGNENQTQQSLETSEWEAHARVTITGFKQLQIQTNKGTALFYVKYFHIELRKNLLCIKQKDFENMETTTSHILLSLMGGIKSKQQENLEKSRLSRFYEDFDDFNQGEVIFCKNNVCIFNGVHVPGYLTLKACTINNEYTRLILHWISNELLQESLVTDDEIQDAVIVNKSDDSKPTVFHIDLTEMRFLKCFFNEDQTSGHLVVGNHENHYKVFHFHLDGMIHLVEIFENWNLCRTITLPPEERARKKAFSIIPLYTIFPNQSFEESRYCPMTKARWKCFLNKSGQLEDVSNFRKVIVTCLNLKQYQSGVMQQEIGTCL